MKLLFWYDSNIITEGGGFMKTELVDNVMQRMTGMLDQTQMQALKMALVICMDGYDVRKEQTELSTEVIDDWEYCRRFLQSMVVAGRATGTIEQYRIHLRILLKDVRKTVLEMTDDDLMLHLARQKYQRNLSNRYLNLKRIVFRSFFGWMRRKKYIRENPAELLDQIRYDTKIKKPYTDEEREKIRCSCQRERDLALVDMLYSTAARVSEIAALNRSDIDFVDNGCIVHGKGGKERPVYLNASSAYHLQMYLRSRTDSNPALFVGHCRPYRRLGKNGIEAILRRLGEDAGVEKVHPHRYRRTALTNAANRGMPLQDVQSLAGHASPNTTMIYCTVDKGKVKAEHKMYLAS